jgi:hypothetical protein
VNRIVLIIFLITVLSLLSIYSFATNYYAVASGNWNAAATWSNVSCAGAGGAGIPGAGDNVTICSGFTVTVDISGAQCASLTFSANSANSLVTMGAGSDLTVSGAITFNNPSADNFNQTFAVNDRTVTAGSIVYANCTNGGLRTNVVTISSGTLTVGSITMNGAANENYLTFTGSGTLYISGNFSANGTFTSNTSTVEYNGNAQTVRSDTYYNLTFSGTGIKTNTAATTVNNNYTVNGGGTVTLGTTANTTNITGNLLVTDNTTFTIGSQAAAKTINVTGDVQVDAGSTINIGEYAATHLLSISGNLVADGDFDMVGSVSTYICNVTFTSANDKSISGTGTTCNFNTITINKGASKIPVLEVLRDITITARTAAGTNLTITNGTFKLSSASTLTPYYGAAIICAGTGRLWINDAGADVSCVETATTANPGIPTVTGTLQISAGTFSYGSGNDLLTLNAATSVLTIDGGTVNIYGGVAFTSTSQFNMTSGNFNIDPQSFDNLAAASIILNFSSTSATNAVTFTGGTLTIVDPHAATGAGVALFLTPTAGYAYNFAGSTIRFGDGTSNSSGVSTDGFEINEGNRYILGDVIMNNGTSTGTDRFVRLLTTDCIIGGDLTIGNNASDDYRLNARTLSLNGNLVNDGTFTSTTANSTLAMTGTAQQTISGSGTYTDGTAGRLLNFAINNSSGANPAVDLQNNLTIETGLTLSSGSLNTSGAGAITLGVGAGTLTITRTNGSLLAVPTWNPGTVNITYNSATAAITTGNELLETADGNIATLTVNNASGVLLNSSDITVATSLTLTNGAFDIQNNLLNITGTIVRTTGTLSAGTSASIYFGANAALLTIPASTFTVNPLEFGNLTINRAGGVSLGNQGITLNGTLTLTNGALRILTNTLTFQDNNTPISRTGGTITTAAGSSIVFGAAGHTGGNAFTIPNATFTAVPSITNLTVNRDNKLTWGNQALSLSGTLTLTKGEFDNNNLTLTFSGGVPIARTAGTLTIGATGTLVFSAGAAFTLPDDLFTSAPASFSALTLTTRNLTLGNQSISLAGNITITTSLLDLANSNITLSSTSAVAGGARSATNMVVISGTGKFYKTFAIGNTAAFIFPVGEITGTTEYSPVSLDFATNSNVGLVGVGVTNALHPAATVGDNYITRYWSFITSGLVTYTYIATFTYPVADVVGADEANFKAQRYDNGTLLWTTNTASSTNAVTHVVTTSTLSETTGKLDNNDFTNYYCDIYYWSKATGNWNGAAVWETSTTPVDPGVGLGTPTAIVPTYANNKGITIRTGNTVTLNAATYGADQLTVTGTLSFGANNFKLYDGDGATDLTIDGTLTTIGGQLLPQTVGIVIAINGTFTTTDLDGFYIDANSSIPTTNAPTINLGSNSTINFGGAATQKIDSRTDYANLQVTAAGQKNAQGAITVNKDLTIATGTFADGGFTISVLGNIANSATHSGAGKILLSGGTSTHTLSGLAIYSNLELNDAQGATLSANATINGTLNLTSGIFSIGAATLTLAGNTPIATSGGTLTPGTTGSLSFTANVNPFTFPNDVFTSSPASIKNITLNRAGGVTLGNQSITIEGALTLIAGIFDIVGNTLTFQNGNTPIVRTAGTLTMAAAASLVFGTAGNTGGNAFVIPNSTFTAAPTFINFSMNRTNSLTLGNQNITLSGTLTVTAGTLADAGRTITVNGNVVMSGTHSGVGNITLTGGTVTHDLSGSGTINNLVMNDALGASLSSNINISGTLTLTSGLITLGAYDLTLTLTTSAFGGVPSVNNMIVTDGAGQLKKNFAAGNTALFTFPVGETTGITEYSPVTMDFSANAVGGILGVIVTGAKHPSNGETDNFINRYWSFTAPTMTNYTYVATFTYPAGDVVGASESSFQAQIWDGAMWTPDVSSTTNTITHVLTTSALTQVTGILNNRAFTSFSSNIYYWSKATGNWNGGVTIWETTSANVDPGVGGGTATAIVPTYSNNKGITIRSGTNITANAATYTADQMTVASGGTLILGANNFTIYNGSGTDLTINGTATTTTGQLLSNSAGVSITINGTLTTADLDGFNIDGNSTIPTTNAPAITLGSVSTINFGGAANQKVDSRSDYANLQISAAGQKNVQGAITVNNNLSITGGTLASYTYQITGNATGTFTMSAGTALTLGLTTDVTAVDFPTNFITANITLDPTSSVTYQTNADQNVSSVPTYGNLILTTGAAISSKLLTGTPLNISGNLIINANTTFDIGASSGSLAGNLNGGGAFSMSSGIFNISGNITGVGVFSMTTGTLNITGNNNQSGAFTPGSGTVNYQGGTNPQTIRGTTYWNLTVSKTAGTVGNMGATVVNNDFIISSGTAATGVNAITITGETNISGTFSINGAGAKIFGDIVVNAGGTWSNTINAAVTINGDLENNSTFTSGTGIYTFAGGGNTISGSNPITFTTTTVNGFYTNNSTNTITTTGINGIGSWTQGNNSSLIISGNATVTTFDAGTNINSVEYKGAALQIIKDATYYNLTLSNTNTKRLAANITILGDLSIQGTAVFDVSTYDINLAGNWNNSSTAADPFLQGVRTVTFNGSSTQTITNTGNANGTVFNNLVVDNSGSGILLNNAVTSANITLTNGAFDLNNNVLTISNTATTGISRTNGYIISEAANNSGKIKWNIAAITGAHIFPFGTTTGSYIPLTFDLTAGTVGNVTISTYPTAADNTPLPTTPVNVTHVNNDSGDDNSANTVDRFWQIDKDGVSGTATITFTATAGEVGTITSLIAQSWDAIIQWNDPLPSQTNTATSATVPGVILNASSPWALSGNDSPLPVELFYFNAEYKEGKVDLNWITTSETNNDYFTVEKSKDAENFETAVLVSGAGNSNEERQYFTQDFEPYEGISYYRLKQTDFDGQYSYSNIVPVNYFNDNNTSFSWGQDGSSLNLNINSLYTGEGLIDVYDNSGKQVLNKNISLTNSQMNTTLNTNNLKSGFYIIRLTLGNEQQSIKVIVQ